MNPIELNLFASRLEAVCEQMGEVLRNAAFSANIRDRLDFSCAIFDADGQLSAQAAHIPVHLGSMAYAMADVVNQVDWSPGDQVVLNDPYLGGTHLPDVTVIAPVFHQDCLCAFVVNRAHHANIGASSPGSMPVSTSLLEEGVVIPPSHYYRAGQLNQAFASELHEQLGSSETSGDLSAQVSANLFGAKTLQELLENYGQQAYRNGLQALNDYAARLALGVIQRLPNGVFRFTDVMDDDGQQNREIRIALTLTVNEGQVMADFDGTAAQVPGNINCPLSVAAAGVFYVFRCLMPEQTPACAGAFRHIEVSAPIGCLLNARYPAAVAAGNVETSTRVVDVTLGALAQAIPDRIPAASHGSMNNLAMGSNQHGASWHYYETIGGGMGAGPTGGGLSGVQTHMTNTLNTPIEVLESRYPLRVKRYALRHGSGGHGRRDGGDGLLRELEFLQPARVSVLTERRHFAPWGSQGGSDGQPGINQLNDEVMPAKFETTVTAGDRLSIATPGGGAWGEAEPEKSERQE